MTLHNSEGLLTATSTNQEGLMFLATSRGSVSSAAFITDTMQYHKKAVLHEWWRLWDFLWIWKIIKQNWKRRTMNEYKSVCSISGKRNTRVSWCLFPFLIVHTNVNTVITAQIQKYKNTYISIIKGKKERGKYGY